MRCKFYSIILYSLLFTIILIKDTNPQIKKEDSLLSKQRIEEIISFLEDSQKVAELKKQLKLIAEAKSIIQKEDNTSTFQKVIERIRNFIKNIPSNWKTIFYNVNREIKISHVRIIELFQNIQSERGYYKSIILGLGGILFIVTLLSRKNEDNLLKNLKKESTKAQKLRAIIYLMLRRLSSGLVLTFSFLFLIFFTEVAEIQLFFIKFTIAIIIYEIFNTLIYLIFSPDFSFLSFANCSHTTLKVLRNHSNLMLSILFFIYLSYNILLLLKLTTTATLFLMVNVIILSFFLPINLSKVKKYYLELFHNYKGSSFLYHTLRQAFSNISLLVIIIMTFLSLISITGNSYLFYFFTAKAVYTIILFSGYLLLTIIMLKIISLFTETNGKLSVSEEYSYNVKLKVIKSVIKFLLFFTFLYITIKLWGLTLENTLKSEILLVKIISRIIAIIFSLWLLLQGLYFLIENIKRGIHIKMLSHAKGASAIEAEKRVSTIIGIIEKIARFLVFGIGIVMILNVIGVDIKAMLAGLGVIGVALGFGAQNLIKDAINGLFLIIENRIRVGDVATINGITGQVEEINLKTIVLRSGDGAIHVIPNGSINTFSNLTHEFSYYVFDIGISYKEDPDRVCNVLKEIGEEIRNDKKYSDLILEPLEIFGVDKFADSSIIIKARIKTIPMKQWEVGREMNRRIKKKFDEMNIEIPYPHRTIVFENLPINKNFDLSK